MARPRAQQQLIFPGVGDMGFKFSPSDFQFGSDFGPPPTLGQGVPGGRAAVAPRIGAVVGGQVTPRVAPSAPSVTSSPQGDDLLQAMMAAIKAGQARNFLAQHQQDVQNLPPQAQLILSDAVKKEGQAIGGPLQRASHADPLTQTVVDVGNIIKGTPQATADVLQAVGSDVASAVRHGVPTATPSGGIESEPDIPGGSKVISKVVVPTAEGLLETAKHPLRHPGVTLLTGLGLIGGAAGAAGRFAAASDAVAGAEAPTLAGAIRLVPKGDNDALHALMHPMTEFDPTDKALLDKIARPGERLSQAIAKSPNLQQARQMILDTTGRADEGVLPRTKADVTTEVARALGRPATSSRKRMNVAGGLEPVAWKSPVMNKLFEARDRRVTNLIDQGSKSIISHLSPQASVAREMAADLRFAKAIESTPVEKLQGYGKTVPAMVAEKITGGRADVGSLVPRMGHLSAAEQKAADIALSGHGADTHAAAHEFGAQQAEAGDKAYGSFVDHEMQQTLSQMAKQHILNPSPTLIQAIDDVRKASRLRDEIAGMTDQERWLAIGSRHAELESMANGQPSNMLQLQSMEKKINELVQAGDAASQTQAINLQNRLNGSLSQLVERGRQLEEAGAARLPEDINTTATTIGYSKEYGLRAPQPLKKPSTTDLGSRDRLGGRSDTTNIGRQMAQEGVNHLVAQRGFARVLALAQDDYKPGFIPVRNKTTVPEDLKAILNRQYPGGVSERELANLSPDAQQKLRDYYFPDMANLPADVKYIDPVYLRGLHEELSEWGKGLPKQVGSAIDTFNAPFRAALLYAKPAYAINLLQNLATAGMQQGVFMGKNAEMALNLGKAMPTDDIHMIASIMGESLSRSFEPTAGFGKAVLQRSGEFWNKVVDRVPRLMAFFHEARRSGFDTPQKVSFLLHDPQLRSDLVQIGRRANREIIDYGGMTPFEQNFVRRVLFFYPWTRAATMWSLRFPLEHPVQAAVYGQLGEMGSKERQKFGHLPSWMDYYADVSPEGSAKPWMMNFQSVITPSTAVETAEGMAGLFHPRSLDANKLTSMLGPAAGAAYTLASGQDELGRPIPQGQSRFEGALSSLSGLLPPVQFMRREQKVGGTKEGGLKAATIAWLGASFAGGRVNITKAQEQGEKDYQAQLAPKEKIDYRTQRAIDQLPTQADALKAQGMGVDQDLINSVAWDLRMKDLYDQFKLQAANAKHVSPNRLPPIDKLKTTLGFIAAYKLMPASDINDFATMAKSLPNDKTVSRVNSALEKELGLGVYTRIWERLVKAGEPIQQTPSAMNPNG